MKKVFLFILGVVLIGIGYLTIKGSSMQEISTEIEISAPPEKVWGIIANVEKWHEWSPIINQSSGTADLGSKVVITMAGKEEGVDGPKYSPTITKFESPKLFRWSAQMMAGFIFTNDKVFELVATETGTRVIHKELFKGLMAPLMCGTMEKGVPPMLKSMNQALKEMAEK